MVAAGITDSGKVREINQDVFKIHIDNDKKTAILVVCDGMGGANAGNVASELAAQTFLKYVSERIQRIDDNTVLDEIAEIADKAAIETNAVVFDKSQSNEKLSGMGTTLVALISTDTGEVVVNIGDSRAYHITPRGILQITKDHSVVEDMIDRGEITRAEAAQHPRKNLITRAIGAEMFVESDVYSQVIDKGDIILLCSDGLSNLFTDKEIIDEVKRYSKLDDVCQSLKNKALVRGAPDNVTIAIYQK